MNIFPWRARHLRRADVEEARSRAAEAEKLAEQAELIKQDIHRMMADNHFVNAIHEVITGRPVPRLPGETEQKDGEMRIKSVTWRFWAATAGALAAYGLLGFWLSGNGNAEEWMYRLGLTIASVIPLLYAGIYTAFGLSSRKPSAKWWRTPLGTAFVLAALSVEPTTAPLAYVFWFMGGMLRASWLAWIEVSGPLLTAIAWLRICYLWVRMRASEIAASTYRDKEAEVIES